MTTCRHVAFDGLTFDVVDYTGEKECFAMLATEVSTYDIFMVCQMGLAGPAAVYPCGVEIFVVDETHLFRYVFCFVLSHDLFLSAIALARPDDVPGDGGLYLANGIVQPR